MEKKAAVIIGTGPEARICLDILNQTAILPYCLIGTGNDNSKESINDIGVFGDIDDPKLESVFKESDVDYIVAIGDLELRKKLFLKLVALCQRPAINAIHPMARISPYAKFGFGNMVNAFSMVNPNCEVGDQNLFQTSVTIEPDSKIGSYCTFSSGVRIGGNCTIEDEVFIGTGAIIHPGIAIGARSLIGAGSVVLTDLLPDSKVFGNPAQSTK